MNMLSINAGFDASSALREAVAHDTWPGVKIQCFDNLDDVADLWLDFQKRAATTAYHSHQWAVAWQATVGKQLGADPRILIGRSVDGELLFLLPLQLRRRWGLRVLEWHGSPDANYGYGLFSQCFLKTAADWFEQSLHRVLANVGRYDVLSLLNMPDSLLGSPHPLHRHFNVTGANQSFILNLSPDYEGIYERKRNPESRRANRRKDNRLQEMGKLEFRQVTDTHELHTVIDLMLKHKVSRLAAKGVHGVFDDEEHRMIHMLADAQEDGKHLFTTHVLTLDADTVAVTFGGWLNNIYWFYISSLAPPGPATKHSPGDHALRRTIEACCEAGLGAFDFGPGTAPYKIGWTDDTVSLFGIVRSNGLLGLPFAFAQVSSLQAKDLVKRQPILRNFAFALRRKLKAEPQQG